MSTTYRELLLQVSTKLEKTGNTTAVDVARRIKADATFQGVLAAIDDTKDAPLDTWLTMIRGGLNDKGNVLVEVPRRAEVKGLPTDEVSIEEMARQVVTLDTLEFFLDSLKK